MEIRAIIANLFSGNFISAWRNSISGSILSKIGISILLLLILTFFMYFQLTEWNISDVSSKREELENKLLDEYKSLLERNTNLQKEYEAVLSQNSELEWESGNLRRKILMLESDTIVDAFDSEIVELNAKKEAVLDTLANSVTTLVETSMLAGDAAKFQDIVENMKEINGVRSIKIYRVYKDSKQNLLGQEAFYDNATIDRVNKHLGANSFTRRKAKKPPMVDEASKAMLERILGKPDEKMTADGEVDGEKVTFIYSALTNKEECQGCHSEKQSVNGVSKIAFSTESIILANESANEEKTSAQSEQRASAAALDNEIRIKRENLDLKVKSLKSDMKTEKEKAVILQKTMEEEKKGVERIEKYARGKRLMATLLFTFTLIAILIYLLKKIIVNPLFQFKGPFSNIANGDLTQRLDDKRNDELGEVAKGFNQFMVKLHALISKMATVTTTVASSATEISANSEDATKGILHQSEQTKYIANSINEMSNAIQSVSVNTSNTSELADKAIKTCHHGEEVVKTAVEGMKKIEEAVKSSAVIIDKLGESSQQIGEIILVIDDIADQTNLLALNAAIEAARAGEHGKGFAVVADEVRKLAERTTKATKEIAHTIEDIQKNTSTAVVSMESGTVEVSNGVVLINEAGSSLKEIVGIINQLAGKAYEIATAMEQQAATTKEVSSNTAKVTQVANEMASGAEEASISARHLVELAEELNDLIIQFKL